MLGISEYFKGVSITGGKQPWRNIQTKNMRYTSTHFVQCERLLRFALAVEAAVDGSVLAYLIHPSRVVFWHVHHDLQNENQKMPLEDTSFSMHSVSSQSYDISSTSVHIRRWNFKWLYSCQFSNNSRIGLSRTCDSILWEIKFSTTIFFKYSS